MFLLSIRLWRIFMLDFTLWYRSTINLFIEWPFYFGNMTILQGIYPFLKIFLFSKYPFAKYLELMVLLLLLKHDNFEVLEFGFLYLQLSLNLTDIFQFEI